MAETTVSELSVEELKELIRDIVRQTFAEMFHDPDEGLELREAFDLELQLALSTNKPVQKEKQEWDALSLASAMRDMEDEPDLYSVDDLRTVFS